MFHGEESYFWFVAKHRLLADLLDRELGNDSGRSVIDVGCGTGGFLSFLKNYKMAVGVERDKTAVEYCRKRNLNSVVCGEIENLGIKSDSFDAAVAADVIEHIDDDLSAIKELRRVLKPDGVLLLTAPAWPWLWSAHDEALEHKRRYTRETLRELLLKADFKRMRIISYMSVLSPAVFPMRWLGKRSDKIDTASYNIPKIINKSLLFALDIERKLLMSGIDLRVGSTLAVMARKD